ncbi:hypothetical protein PHMEG_00020068 [Phytophthora megakarya]|uniref:HAT C-terminal dimerisation domain-containing protein n=1 Tax=Phytophthora megakarya TaxID=4795 RepID=A0A225VR74_9STRA|nr:hypothetical protein PHMEG_00020068 [Phytophthora megakarya]
MFWESLLAENDGTAEESPQKRKRNRTNVASYITEIIRETIKSMPAAIRTNFTANMTSHSLRRGPSANTNASHKFAIQRISMRGAWLVESLTKAFAYIGTTTKEDQCVAKVLADYKAPDLPVSTPSIHDLQQRLPVVEIGLAKRGRPPSALSTNFYRLNERCNKTMWWTVCKYCYAAHVQDRATIPFPTHVHGRKEAWQRHLSDCSYYSGATGNMFQSEKRANVNQQDGTNKQQCTSPPEFSAAEKMMFWRLLLEYQAEALLPDSFVELMSLRRLLVFLNVRCGGIGAIPHRHALSGRVLNEYAEMHSMEQRDKVRTIQNRSGGRVNFLSDVWETIAKLHVLGCVISLFGRILTYDLRATDDRHDGLAIAEQMEGVIDELLASEWNVGAVVTDSAGQCSRARRILAPRFPNIAFIHCFAHDVNNLVKAVLKTAFKKVSEDAAGVASFLNTSTSKWLVRAAKAMVKRYGDSFAVFTLCETRWNSMQACFASLLRARGALEDMAFTYRSSPDLTDKIRVLGDVDFWTKLETAEKIVRPLCTASFRLQRDENTGYLIHGYLSWLGDSLTDLVETRWNACEQPLFILGFFLHPEYIVNARSLPPTVITELDDVCQFAQYYYRRFVNEDDSGLRGEMFAWIQGTYTTSRSVDFNCDVVSMFWEYEKNTKMNSKLPLLALTILSIAVNTATCERLFSELALIQTPRRNRMAIEKTMKHQIMRQYVRNKNRLERAIPTSSKKLLRTVDPRERQRIVTPIGEYGDEATVGIWDRILNAPRASTSSNSNGDAGYNSTPNRQPYPQDNDTNFLQEKRLSGIRSRKTSLASLLFWRPQKAHDRRTGSSLSLRIGTRYSGCQFPLRGSITIRTCLEWGAHLRVHWQTVKHAQVGDVVAGGNLVLSSALENVLSQLVNISERLGRLEDIQTQLLACSESTSIFVTVECVKQVEPATFYSILAGRLILQLVYGSYLGNCERKEGIEQT